MSMNSFRNAVNGALVAALVLGAGTMAQAEEEKSNGKVVQIGRADGEEGNVPASAGTQVQAPKYWIGLLGGPITADSPLRAHLDLPEGQGVIVAQVVPDSPAAKAGLKQHDILLRANETELKDMRELSEMVLAEGPKKGQIAIEVLRKNKRETVNVTPEERPADAAIPQMNLNDGRGFGDVFGGNVPFEFRNFGNGMILGEGGGFGNVPNGVSISVQKEDGQPAKVTVKRGDETWTVTADDPESLKQLPEELRPSVERMLRGGGERIQMPNFRFDGPGFNDGGLRERLERMEQRLEEMQKRLGENAEENK